MKPFFALAVVLAAALAACTGKQNAEQEAIFAVIRQNVQALEREDIEGVMATVHPQSANLDGQRKNIEEMFATFDLKYEITSLKLVSVNEEEAKVEYVQKSHRVSGPAAMPDLLDEGVHTLRKDDGKWKIYDTVHFRTTPIKP